MIYYQLELIFQLGLATLFKVFVNCIQKTIPHICGDRVFSVKFVIVV